MILSDLYKPHDREELEELAERGQLSAAVLASLEPEASYGVWWYGRDATKRTGKLTATGGPARRFGRRPEEDLIAVPVPDAGVPKETLNLGCCQLSIPCPEKKSGRGESGE